MGSSATGSIKLTNTSYFYKITITDSAAKKLLIGTPGGGYYFTGYGAEMGYWLGSSYFKSNSGYAEVGLYYVSGGGYGYHLYLSYGQPDFYFFGVRPVVSLQSNVNLKYNSTSEEWEFVE